MRINKYLAKVGIGSRRAVDRLIEQGQVKVNQRPAQLGMQVNPEEDEIVVKGQEITDQLDEIDYQYWKLYKPVGVISTSRDPHGRQTVVDLVSSSERLTPVGRLDQDSEGLMLLTNDGQLTYKLTHPKFEIDKEYLVWVNGDLNQRVVNHLENGVDLGDFVTAPSQVKIIFRESSQAKFSIIIHKGHNRQIRRMCAHAGLTVTRLKKVRLGDLRLGSLQPGEAVRLTASELKSLRQLAAQK